MDLLKASTIGEEIKSILGIGENEVPGSSHEPEMQNVLGPRRKERQTLAMRMRVTMSMF